ncbi:hypothetical protein CR513_13401, partial [Mucuna pruriens]
MENQLTKLTSLVRQLVVRQHQQSTQRVYGICTSVEHPTDMYPTLRQPYPNRPYNSQQFQRKPYQPNPNQGQYTAQKFRPIGSMPVPNQSSYQQPVSKYQVPSFRQQSQQLANIVSQMRSGNIPSQIVPDPKGGGGVGVVMLRSGRELPYQSTPQPNPRLANAKSESGDDSQVQQLARSVPLPFPTQTVPTKRTCWSYSGG